MNDQPSTPGSSQDDAIFLGAAQGMGSMALPGENFTTRPEIRGRFGVVTSTHWLATAAGMNILEQGGNAFDAACAVAFAQQVVEPHLNGPGGEAPVVLFDAKSQQVKVICGHGPAPQAATIEHFQNAGVTVVPGSGLLPGCVPGAFGAWMTLLRDYGTMSVRDVLTRAIDYARNGYPTLPRINVLLTMLRDLFEKEWTTSAEVYLKNGAAPKTGALFTNPLIADTYERIIKEADSAGGNREKQIDRALDAFYRGFVAEAVDKFYRNEVLDTTGQRHRGLLTGEDMARWQVPVEDPLTYEYHGYTVCKPNAWSQAPVFLQQLALLKGFDLGSMEPNSPDFLHTVTECTKLAMADREKFYGDPAFVDVPFDVLLSDAYNDERRKLVGATASMDLRPGDVPGYGGPVYFKTAEEVNIGADTSAYKGDTCHLDVADRFGNIVSSTPSGGWFRSSPCVPGLGFPIGTRGEMFWVMKGMETHPNALAPGKRSRTSLTPTVVLKDGKPCLAFGTPGGDRQDQWSLLFFLRRVHYGMNLQQAIDYPNFSTKHAPSSFYPRLSQPGNLTIEARIPEETIAEMKKRGHKVKVTGPWTQSRGAAAGIDHEEGLLLAAASPRSIQSYAFGR
ncbi:MAG: gamma-glutamyltransferase family protein [Rhodospirillales bacterium]